MCSLLSLITLYNKVLSILPVCLPSSFKIQLQIRGNPAEVIYLRLNLSLGRILFMIVETKESMKSAINIQDATAKDVELLADIIRLSFRSQLLASILVHYRSRHLPVVRQNLIYFFSARR